MIMIKVRMGSVIYLIVMKQKVFCLKSFKLNVLMSGQELEDGLLGAFFKLSDLFIY